jgi:lysine 2,3-aminomutase
VLYRQIAVFKIDISDAVEHYSPSCNSETSKGDIMAWKEELRNNICTIEQLKQYIALTQKEEKQLKKIIEKHPMSITRYYMSLIDKNDRNDPLRKMVFPSLEELDLSGSYDPSGEMKITKMPGLQHKYSPTALILSTNRCATYCRYCFRKRCAHQRWRFAYIAIEDN